MGTIQTLQSAAKRCDSYLMQYGVELVWSISPMGLRLVGQYGADKVERFITWNDSREDESLNDSLHRLETAVLKGLSS
jgi:hypothetical protein